MKKKKKSIILPKKIKFPRLQKGSLQPIERKKSTTQLYYGIFGLKVLMNSRLNNIQLEAARRQISRGLKKREFLWIRIIPDIPVTKKPNEVRMGKGKGGFDHWIARVKTGQIIFELTSMHAKKASLLLSAAAKKLPVPCTIVCHIRRIK